jgi:tetratricopeptide (TPR) repeat protein
MELRQPARALENYRGAWALEQTGELAIRLCRASLQENRAAGCAELASWLDGHPDDLGVRLFRASLHQSRGEADRAIDDYERAVAQDPRQVAALNNLAWLYFGKGDARAARLAQQALDIQPDSAPVMDTLGWIILRQGDRRRGLELISTAAKRSPGDPDVQYHLAFALAESGDAEKARRTLAGILASNASFQSRAEAEDLMRRLEAGDGGAGS